MTMKTVKIIKPIIIVFDIGASMNHLVNVCTRFLKNSMKSMFISPLLFLKPLFINSIAKHSETNNQYYNDYRLRACIIPIHYFTFIICQFLTMVFPFLVKSISVKGS